MDRIEDSLLREFPAIARSGRRYSVGFARSDAERREAQRLRWRVFVEEMGAQPRSKEPGVDHDLFDPHCKHLLVRDEEKKILGCAALISDVTARWEREKETKGKMAALESRIRELEKAAP